MLLIGVAYSINVGVWVLGLSVLSENTWSDLVNLANQLIPKEI